MSSETTLYRTSDIYQTLGRSLDLTEHRYGHLDVLAFYDKKGANTRWSCRCDCGAECVKYGHQIKAGHVVSCGCEQRRKAKEIGRNRAADLTNQRFGLLMVIGRAGSSEQNKATWNCRCDCGGEAVVQTGSLRSGNTISCGCFQKETMHRIRWNPNLTNEDRFVNRNRGIAVPGVHLWRHDVYSRDGYVCQVCGNSKSGELVAHHKDGWEWCKSRRLDVSNGVTVCVDCHSIFHKTFGYGSNTEGQWVEFSTYKVGINK